MLNCDNHVCKMLAIMATLDIQMQYLLEYSLLTIFRYYAILMNKTENFGISPLLKPFYLHIAIIIVKIIYIAKAI